VKKPMAEKLDDLTEEQPAPYPLLKWITDKTISSILLLLFSPIFILILFGMTANMFFRSSDRGPFLYREPRITRGKQFNLLKFRVMRMDVLARMPSDDQHARLLEDDKSNLTWAGGYLLKKWYFDELPQLVNILKGDMSLVGPRPWPISYVNDQLKRGVIYRNLILAGWTGPTQLKKGHPNPQSGEKLDLEYLNRYRTWSNWRLWRYDMNVLYRTLKLMLEGKGLAY
jgi:lipopolysaccharide/colanic/teichoic acid biosynthesis glycosyltransferase